MTDYRDENARVMAEAIARGEATPLDAFRYPAGDLTFKVSDQADAFVRNEVVVLAEQTLTPGVKYAGHVQVSRAMLDDNAMMGSFLDMTSPVWDRSLRPWKLIDRNPMPLFDFAPRLTSAMAKLRNAPSEIRGRVAGAWSVLRHGVDERDEYDW